MEEYTALRGIEWWTSTLCDSRANRYHFQWSACRLQRFFSISSDDWWHRKNGDSLSGFTLPQKLNSSYRFVSNESGVDDRDLDIVLHVTVVSPHSFPQGPCKAKR